MGLVSYSESESSSSESEAPKKAAPAQKALPGAKKPFQKVVDRSNPGKIVVNLPTAAAAANDAQPSDEPPAKRARTGGAGAGGGRFSGFNSFLPAPKNARNATASKPAPSAPGRPRPAVNLKTSAEPGFSRDQEEPHTDGHADGDHERPAAGGLSLPPPKRAAEPSIPQEQKSADEVKLVGKPLMFKPLSVSRKPNKKKKIAAAIPAASAPPTSNAAAQRPTNGVEEPQPAAAPAMPPKKVSLFSLHTEEASAPTDTTRSNGAYEPMFATADASADDDDYYAQFAMDAQTGPSATTAPHASSTAGQSLDSVADDLNLSAAARRELFGRGGRGSAAQAMATSVKNFNMDEEYQHNEEVRAAGDQQTHNPVRAIQGGKHSLRQLVQNVHNQREALEDSFARGKSNRKEASSKYGW
ncbi:stress activated map kinase interacting [Purpureocillium lavendulum]|uniref:Stress activated map kinase interacting n=1 Tax=Purpureocillium lavendulum TaxID=1247861 RepID=A0AB34G359_9HYPO|nr:stress activated map kinase interacting [Purpureocillium lavendulum]